MDYPHRIFGFLFNSSAADPNEFLDTLALWSSDCLKYPLVGSSAKTPEKYGLRLLESSLQWALLLDDVKEVRHSFKVDFTAELVKLCLLYGKNAAAKHINNSFVDLMEATRKPYGGGLYTLSSFYHRKFLAMIQHRVAIAVRSEVGLISSMDAMGRVKADALVAGNELTRYGAPLKEYFGYQTRVLKLSEDIVRSWARICVLLPMHNECLRIAYNEFQAECKSVPEVLSSPMRADTELRARLYLTPDPLPVSEDARSRVDRLEASAEAGASHIRSIDILSSKVTLAVSLAHCYAKYQKASFAHDARRVFADAERVAEKSGLRSYVHSVDSMRKVFPLFTQLG